MLALGLTADLTALLKDLYKRAGLAHAACLSDRTTRARSSMDRASDYGSEGWGFNSLRARHHHMGHAAAVQELKTRLAGGRAGALLTGAWGSAGSGVPAVLGADGPSRTHRARDLATPAALA